MLTEKLKKVKINQFKKEYLDYLKLTKEFINKGKSLEITLNELNNELSKEERHELIKWIDSEASSTEKDLDIKLV